MASADDDKSSKIFLYIVALCDTQLAYIFSYLKLALLSNCSLDIGGGSSSSSSDWLPDCFSAGGSVTDIEGAIPTGGETRV